MPQKTLPIELWFDIVEYVYYDLYALVDYATLSACSQVCSSWTEPSQKLLFRSVDLTRYEFRRYRNLVEQIKPSTTRGKILGSYIRALELSIGVISSPQCGLRQHEFARLILCCPRLYHLTLRSTLYKFDNESTILWPSFGPSLQ
jgi:hypothetical protein